MLVAQLCLTPYNPMNNSLPGSSVNGILQARMLKWLASLFSKGSSQPRDWTPVPCIAGRFFTIWTTRTAAVITEGPVIFVTIEILSILHTKVNSKCSQNVSWVLYLDHLFLFEKSPIFENKPPNPRNQFLSNITHI